MLPSASPGVSGLELRQSSSLLEAGRIGDALLTFGEGAAPAASRHAGAWTVAAQSPAWRLQTQATAPAWRGFPVRPSVAPPWKLWLIGEACAAGPAGGLADLPGDVARGQASATQLNGHLALLGWNERDEQWHVWTDRFGTVHLYFARSQGRAALGTFSPSVAAFASARRLDWQALTGFFGFGFFPADRTQFDDVRVLRPATHHAFDRAGAPLLAERYWEWTHTPDSTRSYSDTVEALKERLETVLDDEAISGRLAIPISGGLDSRTTVAVLTRPGRSQERLWSYSYGFAEASIETRIAAEIAAARGLAFEAREVGPYLFDLLPLVTSSVEGFQDVTQSRQACVADLLASRADAVIAAHWGDVWLDDMGLASAGKPGEGAIAEHALAKMRKRGGDWLLRHVAAPRVGPDGEAILRDFVARELRPLAGIEDPDFRVKAFKTEQWSFRWTLSSLRMFQAGAFPRLPFYDTRLSDFFATVPTDFVRGRRLQIDYLKRFAPDLARITWQAFDTNLFRHRHFDTWLLPSRAVKKLFRGLRKSPVPQRNWEVQFAEEAGRRGLEAWLLAPGRKLHDLVAPSAVRDLLAAFRGAPLSEGRGYTVSMLLTLSAWLEAYG